MVQRLTAQLDQLRAGIPSGITRRASGVLIIEINKENCG